MSRRLVDLLLKDRLINGAQFQEAEEAAKRGNASSIRHLISKGYVAETKLLYFLGQKFGLPSINLDKFEIPPDVIRLVSPDLVRAHQVIPIQSNKGTLVVAVADPTVLGDLEKLKFALKLNVEAVLTSFSAFDRALDKYYRGASQIGEAIEAYRKETRIAEAKTTTGTSQAGGGGNIEIELFEVHDVDDRDQEAGAVVNVVNGILSEAIRQGASDVHVEPYENRFRVRIRMDGELVEVMQIPLEMRRACLTRIKIMSRMDIAESRLPQDGRIKLRARGREYDFRVNTMPTLFGEKVVLRLLDKSNLKLDLGALGFEATQLQIFRRGIEAPNGIVLVTGPTGSGKTTTLYSALTELNKVTENLSTVEDPIEYNLDGINQVQTHKDIGLTFASVLRTLLRQDPDVILVGEIRDYETAEVAIQAALTGHLVLSTLHTNDAPATIVRLMNMGVEPFLVSAAVNMIVAQRLVRVLCRHCKQEVKVSAEQTARLGGALQGARLFGPKGCSKCGQKGYKGRMAIYEILEMTPALKEMVLKGATALEIRRQAIEEGMRSLRSSALARVQEGTTSLEEALSTTAEG